MFLQDGAIAIAIAIACFLGISVLAVIKVERWGMVQRYGLAVGNWSGCLFTVVVCQVSQRRVAHCHSGTYSGYQISVLEPMYVPRNACRTMALPSRLHVQPYRRYAR